jgi:hypothetical protein
VEGDHARALDVLFDVEQAYPHLPGIHRQIGDIYLATERWDEARRAFQKELDRDADDPAALFGLGRVAATSKQRIASCTRSPSADSIPKRTFASPVR